MAGAMSEVVAGTVMGSICATFEESVGRLGGNDG